MGFLKFPLSSCEMDQLVIIEQHITTSQKIIQLSDEENSSCFDVISEMLLRGVLQDAEVDNCNAYIVTGDFFEFKKWVDLQNEKAQQIMIQKDGIQLSFAPLTANCELLLNEIIEHRDTKGNCDLEYWENRFKQLSFSEDAVLRSQFGILKERNMISIQWASNVPYVLLILEEGLSYFNHKRYIELWNNTITQERESLKHKDYDVFISHANKDKLDYVDELYKTICKLGIKVFYDTEEISWGDKWKDVILNGTEKSEFAIIVISENYFGREWTERELDEFLKRQNVSGQKIVLPLLYNISLDDMKNKYPSLEEIQAIDSSKYSKEEIALLFAKELIKRLR